MPYTIHIPEWLKKSKEDFYLLFVQAWIPFNAWYNREIAPRTPKGSDRQCINYICQNRNDYKNKLVSYLNGTDRDSLKFQQEMVDLHKSLLRHTIPDMEAPINFKTTTIFDPNNNLSRGDFYKVRYIIERTANGSGFNYDIKVTDKASGRFVYSNIFNSCKIENLEGDANFVRLSEALRNKLKKEYLSVDIKAPTIVVKEPIRLGDGSTKKPPHSIEFGTMDKEYFIDDKDKIAQVLIQLLYQLRCEIFHGSLNPSESNMEVYQHAYVIQSMLIKELN